MYVSIDYRAYLYVLGKIAEANNSYVSRLVVKLGGEVKIFVIIMTVTRW